MKTKMATGLKGDRFSASDLVTCSICLERYNEDDRLPKALPCVHTFCKSCMITYYESKLETKLACPMCKQDFHVPRLGIDKLPTDFKTMTFLEHIPAETVNIGQLKPKVCKVHPSETCDLFCEDCRESICIDCLIKDEKHKDHKMTKWKDVVKDYQERFALTRNMVCDLVQNKGKKVQELIASLVTSRDTLVNKADEKLDKAQIAAQRWHKVTTQMIEENFNRRHALLLELASKCTLKEAEIMMEKYNLQSIDDDLKGGHKILGCLQTSVEEWKGSSKTWSAELGDISDACVIDLGELTISPASMPDISSFPFTLCVKDDKSGMQSSQQEKKTTTPSNIELEELLKRLQLLQQQNQLRRQQECQQQ